MKRLLITAALGLFITAQMMGTGCVTVPDNLKEGGIKPPMEPEYAVLVLGEFPSTEETAAYSAGVATALGTKKIIPSIPKEMRALILQEPDNIEHIAKIMGYAGSIMEFDTLVITIPTYGTQTKTFLGFKLSEYEVVSTTALVINLDKMTIIAHNLHHSMYNKSAKVVSLTNAGREAMLHLIK